MLDMQFTQEAYTLHLRLTDSCNADCSYCSSGGLGNRPAMTIHHFHRAIEGAWEWMNEIEVYPRRLYIEYVGGEVTMIEPRLLCRMVNFARAFFTGLGIIVIDGAQTNLLTGDERAESLYNLFEGRIGTSFDDKTGQRKLAGCANKYSEKLKNQINLLETRHGALIPGVLVIDQKSAPTAESQAIRWMQQGRNLTIRPVFSGKKEVDSKVSRSDLYYAYTKIFDAWFMNFNVVVEPFHSLSRKLLDSSRQSQSYCNFQHGCAKNSLDVEPNGDLYVCQEMADGGHFNLGNAIEQRFDLSNWEMIDKRRERMDKKCLTCPYYKVCQGGCMSDSLSALQSVYSRTPHCEDLKKIFAHMSERLNEDQLAARRWLEQID